MELYAKGTEVSEVPGCQQNYASASICDLPDVNNS